MSLTDPTSKMSKSHELERSRILITDSPGEIRAKIASALTDSLHGVSYDKLQRPGISNLLEILSMFDAQVRTPVQLAEEYSGLNARQFKMLVSDTLIHGLQGIRDRYLQLLDRNDGYLESVEEDGSRKARESAKVTMDLVRNAVGL